LFHAHNFHIEQDEQNININKMVWSQEEIDAFKARRAQGEGNLDKVDEFVSGDYGGGHNKKNNTPTTSPTRRDTHIPKKTTTSPMEKSHVDDWIGSPIAAKRR
jgi:hypothetical protein